MREKEERALESAMIVSWAADFAGYEREEGDGTTFAQVASKRAEILQATEGLRGSILVLYSSVTECHSFNSTGDPHGARGELHLRRVDLANTGQNVQRGKLQI